jgi:hypothetical protein
MKDKRRQIANVQPGNFTTLLVKPGCLVIHRITDFVKYLIEFDALFKIGLQIFMVYDFCSEHSSYPSFHLEMSIGCIQREGQRKASLEARLFL